MNKMRMIFLGLSILLFTASITSATTYTYTFQPDPVDLNDLDHYAAYRWGINWLVPDNETITGASIFFDNIRNWDSGSNDLYVDLLPRAREGVRRFDDWQDSGDYFAVWGGTTIAHYEDLPATAQDLTYNFTDSDLLVLIANMGTDGNFGLGFDPDCHFLNDGITFSIETAVATPIPAPILLLATGLIGMAGFRRKFRSNK